jgi:hypothetical protein
MVQWHVKELDTNIVITTEKYNFFFTARVFVISEP